MAFKVECGICKQGPQDGVSVYRTGGKGPDIDPKWRCAIDLPPGQIIAKDVQEAVAVIESATEVKH